MKHRLTILLLCALAMLSSCRKTVGPTNVKVEDPVRHYLPVLCGEELRMLWKIYNVGPEPLVIEDIQPACSAIQLITEVPKVIPVGDSIVMVYHFNTDINLNKVNHKIRIFGNILPYGETDLEFDVQIVPPTIDHSDYEEKYYMRQQLDGATDPETHTHIYYTDSVSLYDIFGF